MFVKGFNILFFRNECGEQQVTVCK